MKIVVFSPHEKIFKLIIIFMFISINIFSQKIDLNDSLIYWNENYYLKWSNYKIFSSDSTNFQGESAVSCLNFTVDFDFENDSISFKINNYFNRNKSWVLKNSLTDDLLQHEQLHFNIDQLYVRKMRKKVIELRISKAEEAKYYQVINELIQERNIVQKEFDDETAHSLVTKNQKKWELKICKELVDLKKYAK